MKLYGHYISQRHSLQQTIKSDNTIVTDADFAIEEETIRILHRNYPGIPIISEEGHPDCLNLNNSESFWVLDPLDGTSQFAVPECVEFCTAIAFCEKHAPVAALLIAPELGKGRTLLVFRAFVQLSRIEINDYNCEVPRPRWPPLAVSATRSASVGPRPFESTLEKMGIALKTRTTSQSLDLLRTAIDLRAYVNDAHSMHFDLFFREKQKLWDGAAGFVFSTVSGLNIVSASGTPLTPIVPTQLSNASPEFESVLVGERSTVAWFQQLLGNHGNSAV